MNARIPHEQQFQMELHHLGTYVRACVTSENADYDVMRQYWEAIAIASLAHNCRRVLLELNTRATPTLADLLLVIEDIREMGLSRLTVAIVYYDSGDSQTIRFAETVALNRGIRWRSFTSRDDAVQWLDAIE